MTLTEEDFKEWREHPITAALFYHLAFIKAEKQDSLLYRDTTDTGLRETIGELRLIDCIETLEIEDLIFKSK